MLQHWPEARRGGASSSRNGLAVPARFRRSSCNRGRLESSDREAGSLLANAAAADHAGTVVRRRKTIEQELDDLRVSCRIASPSISILALARHASIKPQPGPSPTAQYISKVPVKPLEFSALYVTLRSCRRGRAAMKTEKGLVL